MGITILFCLIGVIGATVFEKLTEKPKPKPLPVAKSDLKLSKQTMKEWGITFEE